jgi:hypothetical protein
VSRRIPKREVDAWRKYFEHRNAGHSVEQSAFKARLASSTVYRFERGDPSSGGLEVAAMLGITEVAGNPVDSPLDPLAKAALEDFALFRLRYFGRKSMPWQERAAYEVVRRMESLDREFVVMNEPPGSGKSTLFTCDIPCWLIARDRTIRIQVGSRTERQARMYSGRIKRNLEREVPMRTDADSLARGISFDAIACLMDDYGPFQPDGRSDLWRAEALTVRQLDGTGMDDKEPTVSAWGQDSGFLGGRWDFVIWDDLVDRKNTRTAESKETMRDWYDAEAENRLEPGGLLLLQGQRIAGDDLYRHCLNKRKPDETPKYAHVTFKAHDDDKCEGVHGEVAKPWPDGCLLDPYRLPFDFLESVRHPNPRAYAITYQQEDGERVGGLIDPAWVVGGTDQAGYIAPGILDRERGYGEVPFNIRGRGWSFVTVDPAPSNFWGVIWWVYDPETKRSYAIDLVRKRMAPQDFLSMDLDTYAFSGLITEWRKRAYDHAPITHVIFEANAAQKWFLSQPHVQRWEEVTGITFLPHTTHINKRDPKYGVESLGDFFRQGAIRLPYSTPQSRLKSHFLIDEALLWPDGDTTDMVMSAWFMRLAVDVLYRPPQHGMYEEARPGYLTGSRRGLASWR